MRKRLDLLIKHLLSQFHSVYTMILICGDLCPAYRHTKGEFQPDSSNKRQLCIRNINCAQEFFDRKIHSAHLLCAGLLFNVACLPVILQTGVIKRSSPLMFTLLCSQLYTSQLHGQWCNFDIFKGVDEIKLQTRMIANTTYKTDISLS